MLNEKDYVPRAEFDRLIDLMVPRLERVEHLCFNDEENRPSLETLITKVDSHINVLCSWARGIKFVIVGLGTLAASFASTFHVLHLLGLV